MTPIKTTEKIKALIRELHDKKLAHLRARSVDNLADCPCSLYDKTTHKVLQSFGSRAELYEYIKVNFPIPKGLKVTQLDSDRIMGENDIHT